MCGRFYIPEVDDTPEELMAILTQLESRMQLSQPGFALKRGEICPGDTAAVIAMNRKRQPSVFAMRWGFRVTTPSPQEAVQTYEQLAIPGLEPQPKRSAKLVFNARSESAMVKPLFRESMRLRRCLIPAASYFEWDHFHDDRAKYRFSLQHGDTMYLAGLYRLPDDDRAEFTILTREATSALARFHDRMPVIADSVSHRYLDPGEDPQLLLAAPCDALCWVRA